MRLSQKQLEAFLQCHLSALFERLGCYQLNKLEEGMDVQKLAIILALHVLDTDLEVGFERLVVLAERRYPG